MVEDEDEDDALLPPSGNSPLDNTYTHSRCRCRVAIATVLVGVSALVILPYGHTRPGPDGSPEDALSEYVMGGCETVCTLYGEEAATCKARIQDAANDAFLWRPDACAQAHGSVLQQCPMCSACSPSETGCTAAQVAGGGQGCDAVCVANGQSATCSQRIQHGVRHRFLWQPDACVQAHYAVLTECQACSSCSFKDAGCGHASAPLQSRCFGGWSPPPQCSMSFQYKGEVVLGCTTKAWDQGWCSHDSMYLGSWSDCQPCTADAYGQVTVLPPKGCDTICTYKERSASCKHRIQHAAKHDFRWRPAACARAHSLVLERCPGCSQCDPAQAECKQPGVQGGVTQGGGGQGAEHTGNGNVKWSAACAQVCSFGGASEMCGVIIQFKATHDFYYESNACQLAHSVTLRDCPVCMPCTLAASGCHAQMMPKESGQGGTTAPLPANAYVNNYNGNNPLGIRANPVRSNNYFLILGDWGRAFYAARGPGPCQVAVSVAMGRYVREQQAMGKTLLFIATVGDNFYWAGVTPPQWSSAWGDVYGAWNPSGPLHGVPWLSVHGNHDFGNSDPYAICPQARPAHMINGQAYAGRQLNADRNPARPDHGCAPGSPEPRCVRSTSLYWLPDYNYHYEIPEADLEVIAVDTNAESINIFGGHPGGHARAFQLCGGRAKVAQFMRRVAAAGRRLLRERAQLGTAKTVLIVQHYPGRCMRDLFAKALPKQRQVRVICAYGHVHDQKCHGRDPVTGTCNTILTGGGGGCCEPEINMAGFTAVHLDDNGGFTADVESPKVRLPFGSCKFDLGRSWWKGFEHIQGSGERR